MAKRTRPWWARVDADAPSIATIPDEIIDRATPAERATLAGIWQERGGSELRVGAGFTAVCQQLIGYGADEKVIEIATEAIRDEVHHAQIAVALAARYRGDAERWPSGQDTTVPIFAPSEGKLKAALFVTAMCCINETLACSVLEAQMDAAKSPLARAGYQSVLSDEIDHGRMGWAHLSSAHVGDDLRRQIGDWLPRLFQARLGELFDPTPLPGEHLTEHGILTRRVRQRVIGTGVMEVVLPGFQRIGVNPEKGYAWAKESFGPVLEGLPGAGAS